MKKRSLFCIILIVMLAIFTVSCGNKASDGESGSTQNNTNNSVSNDFSNNSSQVSTTDKAPNSDTSSNIPDTQTSSSDKSDDIENPNESQATQVATFTKEQKYGYYSLANYYSEVYYADNLPDYEMGQWYKVIKSYEELTQIDRETTIDASLFENNHILIVHRHYYESFDDYIGYKDATVTENGFEITLDSYESEKLLYDIDIVIESVEYLIIPNEEIKTLSVSEGNLTINYNKTTFWQRMAHYVSEEKTSDLKNGRVWLFDDIEKYASFMKEYGIARPYFDSGSQEYARLVIYYESGESIGIGYSDCFIEGKEINVVNQAFKNNGITLHSPALCVILIPKSKIPSENLDEYNFNIIVQENVLEELQLSSHIPK